MGNTIELLEHNQKIYDQVIEYVNNGVRKIGIVQDTGLGKTYLSMKLMFEFFKGMKILYVAPTNALLDFIDMGYDLSKIKNINTSTYSALKKNNEEYDVIILDEFHRAGAPTWEIHVQNKIDEGSIVIGLSATPIRYLDNMRDMTYLFDEIIYGMTLIEAFDGGLISKAQKYISTYFLNYLSTDIKKKISSISDTPKGKLILDKMNIKKIIHDNCPDYKDRKWIIFFSSINELETSDSEICNWLDIDQSQIVKVHRGLSARKNKETLNLFSNDNNIKVIKACGMLNEGIHIDNVDGIIMIRKTISPIIYKQQIGRVMKIGNKPSVIIDLVGNSINVTNTINKDMPDYYLKKETGDYIKYIKNISVNILDYTIDMNDILSSLNKSNDLSVEEKKIIDDNIHLSASKIVEILKENGYERSAYIVNNYKRKNGYGPKFNYLSDEEKKIINDNIHLSTREIVEILKENGYDRSIDRIRDYKYKNGYGTGRTNLSADEKKIINDNIHMSAPKIVEILKDHGYERSVETISKYKRKNGHGTGRVPLSDEEKKIINDNIHLIASKIIEVLKDHGYERPEGTINGYKRRNGHESGKMHISYEEKKIINDNIHLPVLKIIEILKDNGYDRSIDYIRAYKYNNGYGSGRTNLSDEEKKIINDNIHLSAREISEILKENGYKRTDAAIRYYKRRNGHGSGVAHNCLFDEEKKIIDDNIHLSVTEIVKTLKDSGYERSISCVSRYKHKKNEHRKTFSHLSAEEKKIIDDNIHLSAPKIAKILKENGYERSANTISGYKYRNGHGSGITNNPWSDNEKRIVCDNNHLTPSQIVEILKENGYERSIPSTKALKEKLGYKATRNLKYLSDEEKKIINDNIHLSAPKIVEILKENGYERSVNTINGYIRTNKIRS